MKLRNLFILALFATTLVACGGGNTGNGNNNNPGDNGNPVATDSPAGDQGDFDPTPPPVDPGDLVPGQGVEDPQAEDVDQAVEADDGVPGQGVVEEPVQDAEEDGVEPEAPVVDEEPAPENNDDQGEVNLCDLNPRLFGCSPVNVNLPPVGQNHFPIPVGNNEDDDQAEAGVEAHPALQCDGDLVFDRNTMKLVCRPRQINCDDPAERVMHLQECLGERQN